MIIKYIFVFIILICICKNTYAIGSSKPFKIGISKPQNISQDNVTTTSTTPSTTTIKQDQNKTLTTITPPNTTLATTTVIAPTNKSSTEKNNSQAINNSNQSAASSIGTYRRQQLFSKYYCNCDFKLNLCDINCCCDIDCSNDMLKTFKCNEEHVTLHDFQYQQGLPSCSISDGWLCVLNDHTEDKPMDISNVNFEQKGKYSWPNTFVLDDNPEENRIYYKYGDTILVYDEQTEEVKNLDLPYSLVNPTCQVSQPIRHLKNNKRKCLMTWTEAKDSTKNLMQQFSSLTLLKSHQENNNLEQCNSKSINNCITFNLHYCSESFKNCKTVDNTTFVESNEEFLCPHIKIIIHHNFTHINASDVYFMCTITEYTEDNIWQYYDIKFLQRNESENLQNDNSGRIGYVQGNPVIKGSYVLVNESAEENEKQYIIDYFHLNSTKNFTIHLPKAIYSMCTADTTEVINFNENSVTQCYTGLDNSTLLLPDSNYTKICKELQNKAFKFLINHEDFFENFDIYISELGSPLYTSSNWIKIHLKNYEMINIFGSYNADLNSFTCQNMILNVKYEFFTILMPVNGVINQNLIKRAHLEFGKRVDLQFKVRDELKIPLNINVMFYDVLRAAGCSVEIQGMNSSKMFSLIFVFNLIYNSYV